MTRKWRVGWLHVGVQAKRDAYRGGRVGAIFDVFQPWCVQVEWAAWRYRGWLTVGALPGKGPRKEKGGTP